MATAYSQTTGLDGHSSLLSNLEQHLGLASYFHTQAYVCTQVYMGAHTEVAVRVGLDSCVQKNIALTFPIQP